MASVTNCGVRSAGRSIENLVGFARSLRAAAHKDQVPLLVLRFRSSAPAQRAACAKALREAKTRVLRDCDLLGHDGSGTFVVALLAPARDGISVATPTDCRATLFRLATLLETASARQPQTGWTTISRTAGAQRLQRSIRSALERGAAERERHAFLTSIGHELRTPLTSVRGYLETLIGEDLDAETTRRFLETARAEAARLERLIEGLHELSNLEADSRRSGEQDGEVLTALAAALDAIGPLAAERRTVICQLARAPCRVRLSNDRVTQILINVIENAVKHGRDAGRVFVSLKRLDDRYAEVCVDDDGPGIPVAERTIIFELACRGSNAAPRGQGLGLALVRLMLERVGGEADITDSPAGGARFRLRFPTIE